MKTRGIDLHIRPEDMRFVGRMFQIAEYVHRKGIFSAVELIGTRDSTLPKLQVLDNGVRIRRFWLSRSRFSPSFIAWPLWCVRIFLHYAFKNVACVSAHSVQVLPICWLISFVKRCPLLYEPHELETELDSGGSLINKPLRHFCERIFIRSARRVTVPNPHTAKWYQTAYGIQKVWVIRNIPALSSAEPLPKDYFATRFALPRGSVVFLYLGFIAHHRGIELLVETFERLPPDRHVVFLGFGPFVPFVASAASRLPNVHLHPPVAPQELVRYAAASDVGVIMLENYSLQFRNCYPGKYCQSLCAERPVLVSDFLLLSEEVKAFNCGWVAPPNSVGLANILRLIDKDEIVRKEEGAREWARRHNWTGECGVIDEVYADLFD